MARDWASVNVIGNRDSIFVDDGVVVEADATLWQNVVLRGTTVIRAGAEIQAGSVLVDTEVAGGAVVKPYCVCEGSYIGPGATVGPFAHLRAGSRLLDHVKIGNFVEVKNTTLHAGAKASHLTYLGDADIGEHANIGAGTITCNYDGHHKHKTTIGAGAFIGSNTALVAPISIGAGAIIGAGSVITRAVPADALALERSEQRTIEGMGKKLNDKNARAAGKK